MLRRRASDGCDNLWILSPLILTQSSPHPALYTRIWLLQAHNEQRVKVPGDTNRHCVNPTNTDCLLHLHNGLKYLLLYSLTRSNLVMHLSIIGVSRVIRR